MSKAKSKRNVTVERAAEAVGHALGRVAGTIESLQEEHPHPLDEAREAWTTGQETLTALVAKGRKRSAAIVKTAKVTARQTKKVTKKARRKKTTAIARVTRTARTVVKRATKAVQSGRKTMKRAVARVKR